MMRIRRYTPHDRQRVLAVFMKNVPDFFDIREVKDLEEFLDRHHGTYFVVEQDKEVIGAGGYHFPDDSTGRLSWYFFEPGHRGQGLGRLLIERSITEMRKNRKLNRIIVETSQLAYRFYEKFGLATEKIEKDYWGKGLDLYLMSMPADKED